MENSDQRFWAKVDKSGACWIWTAGTGAGGYGIFKANRRTITAHRYSLLASRGDPPADKPVVRHACDNVLCVNPAHMCWGTHQENEDDKRRSVAERIEAFARNTLAQESAQMAKRCSTGKRRHPSKTVACIVAKKMKNVAMNVYLCPSCKGWHLGRTRDPYRCAERITQILDQYDRALAARLKDEAEITRLVGEVV